MKSSRRPRRWALLLLFLVIAAAAGAVHAQQPDEREAKARQLFALGQYAEAMDIYGKLYAETTHPTYMRNIGRCYQNLGQPGKAISSFREYLRQAKDLTPEQRSQVQGYIHEMEELERAQGAGEAAPAPPSAAVREPDSPPPPRVEAAPGVAPPPAAPPELRVASPALPEPPSRRTRARAVVGWSLVGAGVVAGVLGAVYGFQARSDNANAKELCVGGPNRDQCAHEDEQSNHERFVKNATRERNVAIAALSAGGVALIGGTVVLLTGGEHPGAASTLVPYATGREAGLVAVARW